jgi:hypothetical protein
MISVSTNLSGSAHLNQFATALARRILAPGTLDEALASGVFLHARTAAQASHFLLNVFAPCIRRSTSLVVHIDAAGLLSADAAPDFRLDPGQNLILLLSDVQLLAEGLAGEHIMRSLKARRDETNLRKHPAGRFILIAAGSPADVVASMAADPRHAFYGATSMPIPSE